MGSRVQSTVGCFPELCFQFSVVLVLVGLRKQFINNFVFPTWACAAGFNNYNNNNSRFSTGRLLAIEDFTFTYDERNLFLAQMCAAFYVKFINNVLPAKEVEEPYAPFSLLSNQLMN